MSDHHFSYTEIVNTLAGKGWGTKFRDQASAERHMVNSPDKLAAFALLEILDRFNRLAGGAERRPESRSSLGRVEYAKAFPGKKPGDKLYSFDNDLCDGVSEYVVIAVDDDGHALVAVSDFDTEYPPRVEFAGKHLHGSVAEAIESLAKSDVEYYSPRLRYAEEALNAVRSGGDLSRFANGENLDEEDDA